MRLSNAEVKSIARRIDLRPLDGSRILITGATGMVGSYMTEALCRTLDLQGIRPREILAMSRTNSRSAIHYLLKYEYLNLGEFESIKDQSICADFVVHAASPASPTKYTSRDDLRHVNAETLRYLINSKGQRIVFLSSGEVYGSDTPELIPEEYQGNIQTNSHRSIYPIAKLEGERVGRELASKYNSDFRIARLFHTFGPGLKSNDGRSFGDFLWSAAGGWKPHLKSLGTDVRTFLYLEDTIVAILLLLLSEQPPDILNIGSEIPISILDFARRVSFLSGHGQKVSFADSNEQSAPSPNSSIIPDTTKLQALGWRQEIDLDESVSRTLKWIRNRSNE